MADETLPPSDGENKPVRRIGNNLVNAGCFIDSDEAEKCLQVYLDSPVTKSFDDPTHIYGHVFGLNSLRSLIYQIDMHNSHQTDDANLIKGVRVYHCMSERNDLDFPTSGVLDDLMFVPVTGDGVDLAPAVTKSVEKALILRGSRPCPNQCS